MFSNPTSTMSAAALLMGIAAAVALGGTLVMQYGFGAEPCQLCVWQRYPHAALIVLGIAGYLAVPRAALLIGGLVALGSAGLALYHFGIENGFWALPAGCAAGQDATSVEELRQLLLEAPPACDQVSVTLFGLSLALWNAVVSFCLALLAATVLAQAGTLLPRPAR
jgi:disulfide bond formation protein DsbB